MAAAPRTTIAIVAAAVAATFSGLSVVVTRVVVPVVGARPLGFYRYGGGSLVLFAVAELFRSKDPDDEHPLHFSPRDAIPLALSGGVAFALFPILYGMSLERISASTGAVLFSTTPLWMAFMGALFLKQPIRGTQLFGVVLTLLGTAILTGWSGGKMVGTGFLTGNLLMLGAAITLAASGAMMVPLLHRYRPFGLTVLRMAVGAALLLPIGLVKDGFFLLQLGHVDWKIGCGIGYLALVGGALGNILWTVPMMYLPATQVFVFLNLSPIIATALSIMFLGEAPRWSFFLATPLALSGVLICQFSRASEQRRRLEHALSVTRHLTSTEGEGSAVEPVVGETRRGDDSQPALEDPELEELELGEPAAEEPEVKEPGAG